MACTIDRNNYKTMNNLSSDNNDVHLRQFRCYWSLLFGAFVGLSLVLVLTQIVVVDGGLQENGQFVGGYGEPHDVEATKEERTSKVTIPVYVYAQDHPIARKQKQEIDSSFESDSVIFETIALTLEEQREFLRSRSESCLGDNKALQKFDELVSRQQEHLAIELWKYCALLHNSDASNPGVGAVYIDASSPLLTRLHNVIETRWLHPSPAAGSLAVLGSESYFPKTIHGSILALRPQHRNVAEEMLKLIVETPIEILATRPLLIPRAFYALIAAQQPTQQQQKQQGNEGNRNSDQEFGLKVGLNDNSWYLFEQTCHVDPLRRSSAEQLKWTDTNSYRLAHHCPDKSGFCCSVYDVTMRQVVLMSRHPLSPYQTIPNDVNRPYNAEFGYYEEDELPFISTIREEVFQRPEDHPNTPNFFDTLLQNNCLPSDDTCSKCLREKKGADCKTCAKACTCYCKTLCNDKVESKFVRKNLIVQPPLFSRDPNRLVPRIVHQTWFEQLSKEKYPNLSRLVESFRMSGWEHKFYSDEDASNFLSTHFPLEVKEAYDTLRPGAFKADLFRYCVLLIYGGVYADVDIMLESSLDLAIAPDVGFMVPIDEPGSPVNRRMCLWNGFIAAAPGHPYLVKAIESIVNGVRNRFTSVDTDATFCPDPELSVLHAFDTLFTAGPCMLGASINRVVGRHGQTSFTSGELDPIRGIGNAKQAEEGTSLVLDGKIMPRNGIPGRTIILNQNKWDMGAHRFTWLARNLIIASTDLPDSNDREKSAAEGGGGGEHYSKTHAKTGIYGLEGLYSNNQKANEDIRIFLETLRPRPDGEAVPNAT